MTHGADAAESRFPGGGGSLRDARAHRAALDAARELLLEVGYAGLTMTAIARRSGVSKPTLYRWWRGTAELVHEAVSEPDPDIPPDTGDLAEDLRRFVGRLAAYYARPEVAAATPGLISDLFGPTAAAPAGAYPVNRAYLERMNRLFARAADDGVLRPGVDIDTAADIVLGAVVSRALASMVAHRAPLRDPDRLADGIVSILLHGITRAPE